MKVVAAELPRSPTTSREDEVERAKENLKGRVMLSMELTSNRMSRLGKSLVTDSDLLSLDQILAEIDAVDADSVSQLAGMLFATEGCRSPASARTRTGSSPPCRRSRRT